MWQCHYKQQCIQNHGGKTESLATAACRGSVFRLGSLILWPQMSLQHPSCMTDLHGALVDQLTEGN